MTTPAPSVAARAGARPMPGALPQPSPPADWSGCELAGLAPRLSEARHTLVEFWAPDVLAARLLAPVRASLCAATPPGLALLCCTVPPAWDGAPHGVTGLPALVLFAGGRRLRRWLGALDPFLLRHELALALADAPP